MTNMLWRIPFFWRLAARRRRLVRLHLHDMEPSIDGILLGVTAGHYVLVAAALVKAPGQTEALDGPRIYVPASKVLFEQELTA